MTIGTSRDQDLGESIWNLALIGLFSSLSLASRVLDLGLIGSKKVLLKARKGEETFQERESASNLTSLFFDSSSCFRGLSKD